MSHLKKTVRVTITKEIEVELTPAMFGPVNEDEYLAEFRRGLWHIDSLDDVIKYAGRMAAIHGGGITHDGLGLVDHHFVTPPRVPDVKFRELDEDVEVEIIDAKGGA